MVPVRAVGWRRGPSSGAPGHPAGLGGSVINALRAQPVTTAGLAVTILVAWVLLAVGVDGGSRLPGFVAGWGVMMAAMMLPSAAPLVLLYRRGASEGAAARLAGGYLAVWTAIGVAAWGVEQVAMGIPAAAVLALAGVYQLTPVKQACLRRCRSPADFLMQRWRRSAFLLGVDHGMWCIGCCWALMAVLVVAGMMGLAWVVGIATVVAAEKMLASGPLFARVTGVGFLFAAVWEVVT